MKYTLPDGMRNIVLFCPVAVGIKNYLPNISQTFGKNIWQKNPTQKMVNSNFKCIFVRSYAKTINYS